MKKNVFVSVSTDPIEEYQKIVDYAGQMQDKADMLHCDVMDGKFVENKTYDSSLVANINKRSLIMLDVHLMIENPQAYLEDYIAAGANILTFHYEAVKDKQLLADMIKYVRSRGVLTGVAIKPETKFKDIKLFLYDLDVLLVMSVNPGMSGQKFIPATLDKIKQIDAYRMDNNLSFKIEVDGGVNDTNAKTLVAAGADILVSGSFVYGAQDKDAAISKLKNCQ